METGTGKTPVSIHAFEEWAAQGLTPILVVAPRAVCYNWTQEGIKWKSSLKFQCFPKGGKDVRQNFISYSDYDVLAVHYDALRTMEETFIARGFKVICFDEFHRLKNRRSKQYKSAKKIALRTKKRLGLTGTPVVHSPLDLWAEFDVISSGNRIHPLGYGSYSSFENSVAIVKPHPRMGTRVKIYSYEDATLEQLKFRVAQHAFERTKDQCLDLPPRQWQKIFCTMGDIQSKAYWDMHNDAVSVVEGIERDLTVSAPMIITQIMRKAQITSGFIRDDETKQLFDLPSCKIETLRDMLPDTIEGDNKAVIFAHFRRDIDAIRVLLEEQNIRHVWVDGRNSEEAGQIAAQFQADSSIKVFLGQPAVVSEGINLFAANTVFYYSNSYNAGKRWQSEDRVYRIGQEKSVTYYDLLCKRTIDEGILDNLKKKKDLARATVSDLASILREYDNRQFYLEGGD